MEWPEEIAKAIDKCSCFIVYITPEAVNSDNVRREVNFALSRKKQIICIYLSETKLPVGMEMQLSAIQAILEYKIINKDIYFEKLVQSLPPQTGNAARAKPPVDNYSAPVNNYTVPSNIPPYINPNNPPHNAYAQFSSGGPKSASPNMRKNGSNLLKVCSVIFIILGITSVILMLMFAAGGGYLILMPACLTMIFLGILEIIVGITSLTKRYYLYKSTFFIVMGFLYIVFIVISITISPIAATTGTMQIVLSVLYISGGFKKRGTQQDRFEAAIPNQNSYYTR
jgi:hypothetical protein